MQRLLNSRQTTQSIEVICKSRVAPFFSSLQIENVVLFMKATLRQCIFFSTEGPFVRFYQQLLFNCEIIATFVNKIIYIQFNENYITKY